MPLKYLLSFQGPSVILLACWVLLLSHFFFATAKSLCGSLISNVSPSEGVWESDDKTTEYTEGTVMTLKCKPGYRSEGQPLSVTCGENGNWTSTTATCKRTVCDPGVNGLSPLEGEWKSNSNGSESFVGTRKTLSCNPGYRREGQPLTVTCQANGAWTRTWAQCTKITCDPFVSSISPSEGVWESDSQTSEPTEGTTMTLRCKERYYPEGEPLTVTCGGDGKWTRTMASCKFSENLCDPVVTVVDPLKGEWKNEGNYSEYFVGTKRTLNCNPGYQSVGRPLTVTCQPNGKWTRTRASCRKIICSVDVTKIKSFEGEWDKHGTTSEFSVGTKRTLNCKPGYRKEGEPTTVECHDNGNWTSTSATCKKIICSPDVTKVESFEGEWNNTGQAGEFLLGMKRTLNCKPGYKRVGEPTTVECFENGNWTSTSAACIKILCSPIVSNVDPLEGEWDKNSPTSEFTVGAKRKLYCKPGYRRIGMPPVVTCLETGNWTSTSVTCKKDTFLSKKHLKISTVPWPPRENCKIKLQINSIQNFYSWEAEKPPKGYKILRKKFSSKKEQNELALSKNAQNQPEATNTRNRRSL